MDSSSKFALPRLRLHIYVTSTTTTQPTRFTDDSFSPSLLLLSSQLKVSERPRTYQTTLWWVRHTRDPDKTDAFLVLFLLALPILATLPSPSQSNFLPIPTKRADPLPNLPTQLLSYITTHFRDTHPEAFRKDVDALVQLRKEFVEPKSDAHPAIVQGLLRWVGARTRTQLSVVRVMSELTSQVSRPTRFSRNQVPLECGCDVLIMREEGSEGLD